MYPQANKDKGLNDNAVRDLINRKYNPEDDKIQEKSGEHTYDMSMTNKLHEN